MDLKCFNNTNSEVIKRPKAHIEVTIFTKAPLSAVVNYRTSLLPFPINIFLTEYWTVLTPIIFIFIVFFYVNDLLIKTGLGKDYTS